MKQGRTLFVAATAAEAKAAADAPMLPALLVEVEQAISVMDGDPAGWVWLLRDDFDGHRYFANLYHNDADTPVAFPTYAATPYAALSHALVRFRQWHATAGGDPNRRVYLGQASS